MPICVNLICNKARLMPLLLSEHFMVHFKTFMQASTCPLLWWWYDEVMASPMFSAKLFEAV